MSSMENQHIPFGTLKLKGAIERCAVDSQSGRYLLRNDGGDAIGAMFPDFELGDALGWVNCLGILEADGLLKGVHPSPGPGWRSWRK
jgi:hypothetical protein